MESYSHIPATEARRAIRKVIAKGGSAMVKVGNEIRCLQHFPSFDRPPNRLPWPFSKFQPFRFRISKQTALPGEVIAGIEFPSRDNGSPVSEVEYNQTQIEEAIETLLNGCQPADEVSVSYNSRL